MLKNNRNYIPLLHPLLVVVVAVMKYHDQKQLIEGFVLVHDSRGQGVHKWGRLGSRSRKQKSHPRCTREAEREHWKSDEAVNFQSPFPRCASSRKVHILAVK